MKKFIKYFSSVLLMLASCMFILEYVYDSTYTNGISRNKISYIMKTQKPVDYIFIGSSRVDNFIDASIIDSITEKTTLNVGVQSSKLADNYLMLQLLFEQKMINDTVFIQLDYTYNNKGSSDILKSALMPYISNPTVARYLKKKEVDFNYLKYIPFYKYMKYDYKLGFRELFAILSKKQNKIDLSNGYFPKFGSSGQPLRATLPASISRENSSLYQINAFAKKNDITVIYFISPICSTTLNMDYVAKLEAKVDKFWDFSTLLFDKDDYFYNCTHTNDKGARVFSEIFAQRILGIEGVNGIK